MYPRDLLHVVFLVFRNASFSILSDVKFISHKVINPEPIQYQKGDQI